MSWEDASSAEVQRQGRSDCAGVEVQEGAFCVQLSSECSGPRTIVMLAQQYVMSLISESHYCTGRFFQVGGFFPFYCLTVLVCKLVGVQTFWVL